VTAVRDLCRQPLTPLTIELNPLRRRGRTLLTGIDLELAAERSFYVESMRSFRRDTWLRLGLFDPIDGDSPYWIHPRCFAPIVRDRQLLQMVLDRFSNRVTDRPDIDSVLCVFPNEARDAC
jgi:hypothetical protein